VAEVLRCERSHDGEGTPMSELCVRVEFWLKEFQHGWLRHGGAAVVALDDVSLIRRVHGRTLGLVGESGSGQKSTLGRCIRADSAR
jgi:ABC-type oligopeptide transport system ATPase subunit